MIIEIVTVITITKDSSRPRDRENKKLTVHLQMQLNASSLQLSGPPGAIFTFFLPKANCKVT